MSRPCSVCSSPDLSAIDEALIRGESCRGVAVRHGFSPDAVERHAQRHLPATLTTAAAAGEIIRADSLLEIVRTQMARVEVLHTAAEGVLKRAQRRRDHATTLDAVRATTTVLREARGVFELLLQAHQVTAETMSREEAEAFVAMLGDAVERHVEDPDVRARIGGELVTLLRQRLPA